ncbi:hypothetical protein [Methylobacterium sp. NFXW15]|uniref:hypothetical protein n=1 Tax=Methylobacterium sp. NFXW15 TaxID=2819512 RepID=UPI003CE682DF
MALTTIRLLSELQAMRAVGTRSVGNWTFSVVGDRAHEVIQWVEGQPLRCTMNAHWNRDELMAVYVMFERTAHSEANRTEIGAALTMFATAFKGVDGWQWEDGDVTAKVSRVC